MPLTVTVPEIWAQYDVVFIGYPIWWDIAAWPVNGFVSGNDFAGKKIVPFATSGGSGLGKTESILRDVCPQAEFLPGKRLRSSADAGAVASWISKLDI